MLKTVIIMTKSVKHGGFCVAGIDIFTGKWIRFVLDEDRPLYNSDLICKNGGSIQVLDIVNVKLKGHSPTYYQPENYLLDTKYRIERISKCTINSVLKLHPPERKVPLFYNYDRKVSPSEIKNVPEKKRYSLALIKPDTAYVYRDDYGKTRCTFQYYGHKFSNIAVTDPNYRAEDFKFKKLTSCLFVMSLGELFEGYHYKLIAQIFEI